MEGPVLNFWVIYKDLNIMWKYERVLRTYKYKLIFINAARCVRPRSDVADGPHTDFPQPNFKSGRYVEIRTAKGRKVVQMERSLVLRSGDFNFIGQRTEKTHIDSYGGPASSLRVLQGLDAHGVRLPSKP